MLLQVEIAGLPDTFQTVEHALIVLGYFIFLYYQFPEDVHPKYAVFSQPLPHPAALAQLGAENQASPPEGVSSGYQAPRHFQKQAEPVPLQHSEDSEVIHVVRAELDYILLLLEDAVKIEEPVVVEED